MKSRSHEIGSSKHRIGLIFDRHSDSTASDVSVKFQSDRSIPNTNLVALCKYIYNITIYTEITTAKTAPNGAATSF